ncbi:MAG: DUF1330 domain-containing protein [Usitatibacter sp.]
MPKGYWIVRVDIRDPEKYKEYIAANAEPFKKYGARFLVRAGRMETVEGTSRGRNAVIEFPSYQAALDCWKSPGYQKAMNIRLPVSTADIVVIEGYDTPGA